MVLSPILPLPHVHRFYHMCLGMHTKFERCKLDSVVLQVVWHCRQCVVVGSEWVPYALIGWYFKIFNINWLKQWLLQSVAVRRSTGNCISGPLFSWITYGWFHLATAKICWYWWKLQYCKRCHFLSWNKNFINCCASNLGV